MVNKLWTFPFSFSMDTNMFAGFGSRESDINEASTQT